ncbi:hypothetical protein C4577_04275 [Candidatus Parcubacteria bacterium]|nr:MAG: hypothetical protein C4577_04275 [Candidatus Parcubacteria bacterium]
MKDDQISISTIDKYKLDDELVIQADLYDEYAKKLGEARADLEDAKNEVKVREDDYDIECAKVDLQVRKNPKNFGLDKLTEPAIKCIILLDSNVTTARKALYDARREVVDCLRLHGALDAMVGALDYKKRSLEDLVKLRLANYYSEPRLPKGKEDIRSEIQDSKRKKMYDSKLKEKSD